MNLTERQKRYLRGLAHDLKPVVTVGDKGVTNSLSNELYGALEHHELIKIRVRVGDRNARDAIIKQLAAASQSTLISRIGNIATLYRPRIKKPGIALPPN